MIPITARSYGSSMSFQRTPTDYASGIQRPALSHSQALGAGLSAQGLVMFGHIRPSLDSSGWPVASRALLGAVFS